MALRVLVRNKVYTLINVLGLALGICACIVIYVITSYELSFDRDHPDGDRIYRLGGRVQEDRGGGVKDVMYTEDVPPPTAETLHQEVPGIEAVAPFYRYEARNVEGAIITTPGYFSIFQYKWLAGNPATSLTEPFSVVLSERKARKYFGSLPPDKILGKEIVYDDSVRVRVSGVIKDWEMNTDIPYTEFISWTTIGHSRWKEIYHTDDWEPIKYTWTRAFVKLAPESSLARMASAGMDAQLAAFATRHLMSDSLLRLVHFNIQLQPLSDIHFNANYNHDGTRTAPLPTLYALMGIALFILLIAVVNFINLSTAQSLQRARETGVRKVLGSSRAGLIGQFLIESFILTLLAAIIAVLLVGPVLALFRNYIPSGVTFTVWHIRTLLFLLTLTVTTSLLAGLYPARVLSSYVPVVCLKGGFVQHGKWDLRKILITFQFAVSLFFIIGVFGIRDQIRYMLHSDPGFSRDAVLTVDAWGAQESTMKLLQSEVKRIPGIEGCVLQGHAPMSKISMELSMEFGDKDPQSMLVSVLAGGKEILPFYQMKLVAGRNLDKGEYVINETFCRAMGFKDPSAVIGKTVRWQGKVYPVVGVAADFHTGSFHERIRPLAIVDVADLETSLGIRVNPSNKVALERIREVWRRLMPGEAFPYSWLDESIAQLYMRDRQAEWLITVAMLVAIFISCMGVLGLILFVAERRGKEMGIRKVLGAGVGDIAWLLSRDIVWLMGLALLIVMPMAWYGLHRWLEDFAYRIEISGWLFVLAGLTGLGVTMLTISVPVIRAAISNPVERLRSE